MEIGPVNPAIICLYSFIIFKIEGVYMYVDVSQILVLPVDFHQICTVLSDHLY